MTNNLKKRSVSILSTDLTDGRGVQIHKQQKLKQRGGIAREKVANSMRGIDRLKNGGKRAKFTVKTYFYRQKHRKALKSIEF